jgi:hypothetical protein
MEETKKEIEEIIGTIFVIDFSFVKEGFHTNDKIAVIGKDEKDVKQKMEVQGINFSLINRIDRIMVSKILL